MRPLYVDPRRLRVRARRHGDGTPELDGMGLWMLVAVAAVGAMLRSDPDFDRLTAVVMSGMGLWLAVLVFHFFFVITGVTHK